MASELRVNNIKNRSGLGTVTFADEGLIIAGITSLSLGNSTLIVGSAASTGTANQTLQASGGAYVSGNLGVGLTNPTSKLDVSGDTRVTGVVTATTFSGNIVGTAATFTGNVSIAGTLTYEDVTNVDSVGLVTARAGAHISGGNLLVGSTSATGTSSQPLQVTGGAYVSGNVGVGWTNPLSNVSINGVAPGSSPAPCFTIPNSTNPRYSVGLGAVLVQNVGQRLDFFAGDSTSNTTNLSSSHLRMSLTATGNLGIGTTNPSYKTHIVGSSDILALESLNSAERTTLKLITNGSDWELGARGSASSPANAFYIYDNAAGAYRQVIDSSGNLLIGTGTATGTASQTLQVVGGGYFSGSVGIGDTNPSGGSVAQLSLFGYNAGGGVGYHQFLKIRNNYGSATNPAKYFRLNSSGGVEVVNDAYTAVIFTLDNSGNITAAGNVGGYSDIRLKDNIQTIPNALDKVSKLRGVEFDRNDIEENPHQIGVIAQEVEEIIPEVVQTNTDGIKSVSYGNLVGLLIEAIKDLKEEVNELKAKLEEK